MVKYFLFSTVALVLLYYQYTLTRIIFGKYPYPLFEMLGPLLFTIAGLLYLNKKRMYGGITTLLALGVIARQIMTFLYVLCPALQSSIAYAYVVLVVVVVVLFVCMLYMAIYSIKNPVAEDRYEVFDRYTDNSAVRVLSFLPLLLVVAVLLWYGYSFCFKVPMA